MLCFVAVDPDHVSMWWFYDNTMPGKFCGRSDVVRAPMRSSYQVAMTTKDFVIDDDYVIQYEVAFIVMRCRQHKEKSGVFFRFLSHARKQENLISLFMSSTPQTLGKHGGM